MGLAYVSIRAIDLKKTVDFYTKEMGMKETRRWSPIPGEIVVNLIDKETKQKLNVMWYDKTCKLYTPYKMDGVELDHLMFEVKDAKKSFEKLVKKGWPIAMNLFERDNKEGHFAMGLVKDPNGIWVGVKSLTKRKGKVKRK